MFATLRSNKVFYLQTHVFSKYSKQTNYEYYKVLPHLS